MLIGSTSFYPIFLTVLNGTTTFYPSLSNSAHFLYLFLSLLPSHSLSIFLAVPFISSYFFPSFPHILYLSFLQCHLSLTHFIPPSVTFFIYLSVNLSSLSLSICPALPNVSFTHYNCTYIVHCTVQRACYILYCIARFSARFLLR